MTDQYLDPFWRNFNKPKKEQSHSTPKKPTKKEIIEYMFGNIGFGVGGCAEVNYYTKIGSKKPYKVELICDTGELFFSGRLKDAISFMKDYQSGKYDN